MTTASTATTMATISDWIHDCGYGPQMTTAVAPRTSTTVTGVPGGSGRWPSRPVADQISPPILT